MHRRLFAVLAATLFAATAQAVPVTHATRAGFEAGLSNIVVDDFNSASYGFINTAATMKALSAGSIGYESTFHNAPDWNIVSAGLLCWGCNGSGRVLLDDTTIGTADGVYGFGADLSFINGWTAFVTFGDGSTANYALANGFFGITADELIKQVHFGLPNGDPTANVGALDNVTIGNRGTPAVPEPTALALALLGFAGLRARRTAA